MVMNMIMENKKLFSVDKFDKLLQTWTPVKTFFSRLEAENYILFVVGKGNHIPFRVRPFENLEEGYYYEP